MPDTRMGTVLLFFGLGILTLVQQICLDFPSLHDGKHIYKTIVTVIPQATYDYPPQATNLTPHPKGHIQHAGYEPDILSQRPHSACEPDTLLLKCEDHARSTN